MVATEKYIASVQVDASVSVAAISEEASADGEIPPHKLCNIALDTLSH
jgi:hypothetical protein